MYKSDSLTISIYGIGNFGFALLKHLDRKNSGNIKAFDRNEKLIENLRTRRRHLRFHKDVKVSSKINFCNNSKDLLQDSDILLLAVHSDATREVLNNIKKYLPPERKIMIVNTAKALDNHSGRRLSEIAQEELHDANYSYSLLAGGTIAKDLFKHEPLGMDLASKNIDEARFLADIFSSDNLKVYPSSDLIGVEYASALKNVISILAGIISGLGLSYGSETHVISRTAELIAEACVSDLGADKQTFSIGSQSWGNDLWMSCTGKTRNREFGTLIGKGKPVSQALETMAGQDKIVEGINTIRVLDKIEPFMQVAPIHLLYDLIIEQKINHEIFKKQIFNSL